MNTDSYHKLLTSEKDKDIFIFFAGPACFSCAAVWPEYEKVVRALSTGSENLIFAFVDLTHNELQEEAKVYGFPSLRLYPANTERKLTWLDFTQEPNYGLLLKFL